MINELLIPEFEAEMATTRRFLERLPEDRLAWRPHAKSWTLGQLATHIANIPMWTGETVNKDELDIAPVGKPPYKEPEKRTRQEVLDAFDKNVVTGREALSGANPDGWMTPWTLLSGGKTIVSMPRYSVMRNFVLNHLVHHRAHLGVYLRLTDVPVPGAYGPSADEG